MGVKCNYCGAGCDCKEPYNPVLECWEKNKIQSRLQTLEYRIKMYKLDPRESKLTKEEIKILRERVTRHNNRCESSSKIRW